MALVQERGPVQGQATPPAGDKGGPNVRFDPIVIHAGVASHDWRAGTTTNAIGLNIPAVNQGGRLVFFAPYNGQYVAFKEGGKAPFECTLYQARLVVRAPFERSMVEIAGVPEHVMPRGAMLSQIIGRGRITLRADKIPIWEDQYVDTLGQASGVKLEGAAVGGGGTMRGQGWTDGFALPEPIECSSAGPALEGWIDLLPDDLVTLGQGILGLGIGAPLPPHRYIDAANAIQVCGPMPTIVSLEFFGQRGLNIRSGQVPMPPGLPCYYPSA